MAAQPAAERTARIIPPPSLAQTFGREPLRYTQRQQPAGDEERTADTIAEMRRLIVADSRADIVRRAALEATLGASSTDVAAARIWQWVRNHVRYIDDTEHARPLSGVADDAEVLIRPADLIAAPNPAGDCDDMAMLVAAMLRAVGIPSMLRTIAADSTGNYSHVYTVALTPCGKEIALDASHGPEPGWEPTARGKSKTWPVDDDMSQLGAIDWGSLIQQGVSTTSNILTARYAVPPAGTYIQTRDAAIQRTDPQAYYSPAIVPMLSGGSILPWLIGVGALVLVLMSRK